MKKKVNYNSPRTAAPYDLFACHLTLIIVIFLSLAGSEGAQGKGSAEGSVWWFWSEEKRQKMRLTEKQMGSIAPFLSLWCRVIVSSSS
ncbi:UNVERIFIED_CONTAM: hypothetical protein Slati_3356000 [Sesamum latifolium]|uniref:Uncharacterized protein n=1 Tax=Sesamum latifolium TaxID=2727402 RepID=A0AAW2UIN2_9LAMI